MDQAVCCVPLAESVTENFVVCLRQPVYCEHVVPLMRVRRLIGIEPLP
jgi:hypothetical protein